MKKIMDTFLNVKPFKRTVNEWNEPFDGDDLIYFKMNWGSQDIWKKTEKIYRYDLLCEVEWILDGYSLKTLMEQAENHLEEGDNLLDFEIHASTYRVSYDEYQTKHYLLRKRLETETEQQSRLQDLEAQKQEVITAAEQVKLEKEAKEKAQYEKLKEKYEGKK